MPFAPTLPTRHGSDTPLAEAPRPCGPRLDPDRAEISRIVSILHRASAILAIGLFAAGCGSGDERPNLVLITLDTTRADHLGCYGYARAHTPNLDAFASSGARFDHTRAVANVTLPAHAAILTGHCPQSLGVPRNSFPLPGHIPTLAQILATEGYSTAAFVSASVLSSDLGLGRGFEVYDEAFSLQEMGRDQRRAAATTKAARVWLADLVDAGAPYFLWVHYFDPHFPYTPPAPYDTLYGGDYDGPADGSMSYLATIWGQGTPRSEPTAADLTRLVDLYDGEIAYLDHALGPLLDAVDSVETERSTVVAITADHGESLVEHDYLFNHGLHVYEPSVNVPLLVRFAPQAGIAAGTVVSAPTQNMDLFTTFLVAAGATSSDASSGTDLAALAREQHPGARLLFTEAALPLAAEDAYPGVYQNLHKSQCVTDWPWKLIVTPFERRRQLYRLDVDAGELHDLSAVESERVRALSAAIQQWREQRRRGAAIVHPRNLRRLRSLGYVN